MLIIFEMRDDTLSVDQATDLIQKSAFCTLCIKWQIQPGSIATDIIARAEEVIDADIVDESTNGEK